MFQVLFEFLSFKNDVASAGLSVRTTLWHAFSQIVIFLYLYDEHTSMIVVISAGIGALIAVKTFAY